MNMSLSVCPELVEGLSFVCDGQEERQGFDKLSPNGFLVKNNCQKKVES
jgi:hypothetical protein